MGSNEEMFPIKAIDKLISDAIGMFPMVDIDSASENLEEVYPWYKGDLLWVIEGISASNVWERQVQLQP